MIFLLVGLAVDATIGLAVSRPGAPLARGGRAATALAVTALAVTAGLTFATLTALLLGEALHNIA